MRFESFEQVLVHTAQAIKDSNPPVTNLPPVPMGNGFDAAQME
jgi:hypothetical protein